MEESHGGRGGGAQGGQDIGVGGGESWRFLKQARMMSWVAFSIVSIEQCMCKAP